MTRVLNPNFPPGYWHACPSYPGYFASSDGRVIGRRGKVLRPKTIRNGYLVVEVYSDGGAHKGTGVNRLVCDAFYGSAPTPQHDAAHWDGVKKNNKAGNLRWATKSQNCRDKRRHGTDAGGERNHRALITADQAREIREAYRKWRKPNGWMPRGFRLSLADKFGVGIHVIAAVADGRTWREVSST